MHPDQPVANRLTNWRQQGDQIAGQAGVTPIKTQLQPLPDQIGAKVTAVAPAAKQLITCFRPGAAMQPEFFCPPPGRWPVTNL